MEMKHVYVKKKCNDFRESPGMYTSCLIKVGTTIAIKFMSDSKMFQIIVEI